MKKSKRVNNKNKLKLSLKEWEFGRIQMIAQMIIKTRYALMDICYKRMKNNDFKLVC